ncbi:unnamed protein product, partial [Ixodes pacificus]
MDFRRKEVDGLPCLLVARMAGSGDRRTDSRRRGHNDGDPAPASPRGTSRSDLERGTVDAFPNGPRMCSEERIRCRGPRVGIGVHDGCVSDSCVYLLFRLLLWISASRQRHER